LPLGFWANERYRSALAEYIETGSRISLGYALAMGDLAGAPPAEATADAEATLANLVVEARQAAA